VGIREKIYHAVALVAVAVIAGIYIFMVAWHSRNELAIAALDEAIAAMEGEIVVMEDAVP
jgi:hypothetical protein